MTVRLTISVDCGGGAVMTLPNPALQGCGIDWMLRYTTMVSSKVRFGAASVIDSYEYLLSSEINDKEAVRRLRLLRRERKRIASQV